MTVASTDLAHRRAYKGVRQEEDPVTFCLSQADSYDAQLVSEDADSYIVYLEPRTSRCADGGFPLFGGAATYQVSKSNFHILGATFWE